MSVHAGPNTIKSGLVLHLDASNPKSYPGTGTSWFDLSGNNNHGTLTNMSVPSCYVRTYGGRALDFDGVDDSVNIASLSMASSFSFVCWFNKRSNGTFNERILLGLTGSSTIYISVKTSSVDLAIGPRSTFNFPAINNNNWNCFVITRDTSNLSRCFLNGIESSTGGLTRANTYSFDKIGNYPIGSASNWDGQLDDVRIYNRALSQAEIQQNYNATRGRFGL